MQEGEYPPGGQHWVLFHQAQVQLLPLPPDHHHPPDQAQRDARHLHQAPGYQVGGGQRLAGCSGRVKHLPNYFCKFTHKRVFESPVLWKCSVSVN